LYFTHNFDNGVVSISYYESTEKFFKEHSFDTDYVIAQVIPWTAKEFTEE
jgi:hypothetical protein